MHAKQLQPMFQIQNLPHAGPTATNYAICHVDDRAPGKETLTGNDRQSDRNTGRQVGRKVSRQVVLPVELLEPVLPEWP